MVLTHGLRLINTSIMVFPLAFRSMMTNTLTINDQEAKLSGTKVSRDQPTAYPRNNLVIEGWIWSADEIPRQVLLAQMQVALEIKEGIDPYNPPPSDQKVVKSERVEGAVAIEYAVDGAGLKLGRTSKAQALLNALFKRGGLYTIPIIK